MPVHRRPVCSVTIASSDSGGGAGIQADLLTFAAHGVYGATVLVAVTAQNSKGISGIERLSPTIIRAQMDAVFPDLRPSAVKIGALLDERRIRAVVAGLRRHHASCVVLDPVMVAKSGTRLLSSAAVKVLVTDLLPLCGLVTPNLPEAEALCRIRIASEADRREAARAIAALGARAVLIKGGHGRSGPVTDLLYDGRRFHTFVNPRLSTRATHGTGCTLSSAIAANLALGRSLRDSVRRGIVFVRAGLKRGIFPGRGWGTSGHFLGSQRRHPEERSGEGSAPEILGSARADPSLRPE
jgi:hydroxymethylpyrimidine/phosphomethylpyrimidine kinase